MRRYLAFFGSLFLWLVIAFNAWFLWPSSLGGATTFVVVNGSSMEPLYSSGDLVVARKGSPGVGDVVVYRPEGLGDAKVVHQIVGGDAETGWDVQGINNAWLDQWHPTNSEVAGIVVLRIDASNRLGSLILSPLFWGAFLVVAVGLLLWPERTDDGPDGSGSESGPDGSERGEAESSPSPFARGGSDLVATRVRARAPSG